MTDTCNGNPFLIGEYYRIKPNFHGIREGILRISNLTQGENTNTRVYFEVIEGMSNVWFSSFDHNSTFAGMLELEHYDEKDIETDEALGVFLSGFCLDVKQGV